jgi:hypothetical protein
MEDVSFTDPIIPLGLLLEIACWIGPDRKNLQSGPIRCFFPGVEFGLMVLNSYVSGVRTESILSARSPHFQACGS